MQIFTQYVFGMANYLSCWGSRRSFFSSVGSMQRPSNGSVTLFLVNTFAEKFDLVNKKFEKSVLKCERKRETGPHLNHRPFLRDGSSKHKKNATTSYSFPRIKMRQLSNLRLEVRFWKLFIQRCDRSGDNRRFFADVILSKMGEEWRACNLVGRRKIRKTTGSPTICCWCSEGRSCAGPPSRWVSTTFTVCNNVLAGDESLLQQSLVAARDLYHFFSSMIREAARRITTTTTTRLILLNHKNKTGNFLRSADTKKK